MHSRARFRNVGSCYKGVEVAEKGHWRAHSTDAGVVFLHDLVLEFKGLSVAFVGSWVNPRIDRTFSAADDYMLSSLSSAWMESVFPSTWSWRPWGTGTTGR